MTSARTDSLYEVKIGPVWSISADFEINMLPKARKKLAQSADVYPNENCCSVRILTFFLDLFYEFFISFVDNGNSGIAL
jgi:hypothetical protein